MIIREQNSKFRCIEKYKDPSSGKWKSVTVTIDKNTAQKRNEAYKRLEAMIAVKCTPKTETRLQTLVDAWIQYQKTVFKASTWKRNESTGNRLVQIIGDVPLCDLTAGLIRSKLLEHTTNAGTLNEYIARLKALIRWGYQNDYLRDTICIDKLQRFNDDSKHSKVQDKYLEPDELKAVIEAATPFYGSVIEFMALSGLRIGEAIALTNDDVHPDFIMVNKTYDPRNKQTTTPKTPESIREVHVQPELKAVIVRILAQSQINRFRNSKHYKNFLLGPTGEPLSYWKFNRIFGELTEKVTGRKLPSHALRHTHASLLAASGVPLETISRRLGHADSKITREIYLHVTEKTRARDAELIDSVSILRA